MRFADLLREYIGDRTLESIVTQCQERGIEIDRIYLGRLRSGDRLPPDDEKTTMALAEICGRDPYPLVLLARVERKPRETLMELLTLQSEAHRLTVEVSMQNAKKLARIGELLDAGAGVDELKAYLAQDGKNEVDTLRRSYEVNRDWMQAQRVLMAARPDITLSLTLPGLQVRRSEDALLDEIADVAHLPKESISLVIQALKQVARHGGAATKEG